MADFSAQQVLPGNWNFQDAPAGPALAQAAAFIPVQATLPGVPAQEQAFSAHYRAPVHFVMRSFNTTLVQYVIWVTQDAADFGGLQSGYPPIQLSGTTLIGMYL